MISVSKVKHQQFSYYLISLFLRGCTRIMETAKTHARPTSSYYAHTTLISCPVPPKFVPGSCSAGVAWWYRYSSPEGPTELLVAGSIYRLQGTESRKGNISFSLDTQNATSAGGLVVVVGHRLQTEISSYVRSRGRGAGEWWGGCKEGDWEAGKQHRAPHFRPVKHGKRSNREGL